MRVRHTPTRFLAAHVIADLNTLWRAARSWWLRYYHVKGAMHVHRNSVVLRSRPWHYKWRPNVADHWVARYTAGLYTLVPGGQAMMPSFMDDVPTSARGMLLR